MTSLSYVIGDDSMSASLTRSPIQPSRVESDAHVHGSGGPSSSASNVVFRDNVNGTLIEPSSPRCRYRSPTLLPTANPNLSPLPASAISFSIQNSTYNSSRQDGHSSAVNSSLPPYPISSSEISGTSVESPFAIAPHDESLNSQSNRLRTTQLFPALPDLAAHYGIPQLLPPAPRTTPRNSSSPPSSNQTPESVDTFQHMCSNYLNMLAQKSDDKLFGEAPSSMTEPTDAFDSPVDQAAQSVYDCVAASPWFSPDYPMSEFLTSPVDDSPFDDMLPTPHLSSDMLTSPLLNDGGNDAELELFGGLPSYPSYEEFVQKEPLSNILPGNGLDLDNLYPISPTTPALNSTSLFHSPHTPTSPSFAPSPSASLSGRRKSVATGTRKNVTPDTLVALDAPTQPRKYTTPSATSRKDVPAVFAKKRARLQAFGDEDDEPEEPLPPNATEKEQIEWKRRQNTLAARKSRKRKLQHQLELEAKVAQLSADLEMWKVRAQTYESMLRNHGFKVPDFSSS
jgi:hypothetical protein